MDRLVALLNPRLEAEGEDAAATRFCSDEFETVFAFATEPHKVAADYNASEAADPVVLYRAFPDDWVLAKKPKIGPPKTLLSSSEKPSDAEIQRAVQENGSSGGVADFFGGLVRGG
mmetsp:Transcript_10420/g.25915  ORF Transcript_10420/g.25915 Transcript_10420/m.25915 type:complete len:116 (+) Transcript_10420:2-349(+)